MLWACNTTPLRETPAQHTSVRFTAEDTLAMERCAEMLDTMVFPKVDTPIWGYRFSISGDFNGDGAIEIFNEHYYSRRDKRETNKYFSGNEDIYDLDRISNDKDVLSFMSCDSCGVDTLPVYGVTGPLFVKNEGDLDGDGGDEVGFVPALPQMSSMNHYHILSYKRRHWVEVYSFGIREWELPPQPTAGRMAGWFGMMGFYNISKDDTLNQKLEKNLKSFDELLKPIKKNKARIKTWTDVAEDSFAIVDFKKMASKRKQ